MEFSLLNFILALATNELLHNVLEVTSARRKVARLGSYMDGQGWKESRVSINSRPKAYAVSIVSFFVFVSVLFVMYAWLNLHQQAALVITAVLLLLSYTTTAALFDRYHVDIERLTKPFKETPVDTNDN